MTIATNGQDLIGETLPMRRLLTAVERVANKDVTVLVRGETGTGKELISSLIHASSRRAGKPLVKFNCAALSSELAESQLFGHAKGAFTGAVANHRGFFAEADGGTIVLDEVGELEASTQAALLRALQDGEIQPLGSSRVQRVDVRIIAVTNRDLMAEVRAGRFRADLYYRLAVVELVVPSLRERRADIPALAGFFARRYANRFGLAGVELGPRVIEQFTAAEWPGNIRQLENTIAGMVALSDGGLLDDADLDDEDQDPVEPAGFTSAVRSLTEQVHEFERTLVLRALEAARGNQSEAARRLAMSRTTLIDKLKKHGLAAATG